MVEDAPTKAARVRVRETGKCCNRNGVLNGTSNGKNTKVGVKVKGSELRCICLRLRIWVYVYVGNVAV